MARILSEMTASITELKINPMHIVQSAGGDPIAILNHNKPAFYCVPADVYEQMLDALDDMELIKTIHERKGQEGVEVNIDDL